MTVIRKELGVFAALAALPAVLPAAAAPAEAVPVANQCMTRLLSPDEMRAGVQSQVDCYRTHSEMLAAAGLRGGVRSPLGYGLLATHYIDAGGQGGYLSVFGDSCQGGSINLSAPYNDSISSTVHRACGRIKHFSDADANGDNQITIGSAGAVANINGAMNDRTSSIYYYSS